MINKFKELIKNAKGPFTSDLRHAAFDVLRSYQKKGYKIGIKKWDPTSRRWEKGYTISVKRPNQEPIYYEGFSIIQAVFELIKEVYNVL